MQSQRRIYRLKNTTISRFGYLLKHLFGKAVLAGWIRIKNCRNSDYYDSGYKVISVLNSKQGQDNQTKLFKVEEKIQYEQMSSKRSKETVFNITSFFHGRVSDLECRLDFERGCKYCNEISMAEEYFKKQKMGVSRSKSIRMNENVIYGSKQARHTSSQLKKRSNSLRAGAKREQAMMLIGQLQRNSLRNYRRFIKN